MNRRRADRLVTVLVGLVLVGGVVLWWQADQARQARSTMMGSMMNGGMGGVDPFTYLLGTAILAVAVGGVYLAVRDELPVSNASRPTESTPSSTEPTPPPTEPTPTPNANARKGILSVLPDDERRILEPVIDDPGLTQIALRDRADFSKSKVSQTVSDLEKRGLLYRERQGRTYRVYPSDDVAVND